MNIGKTITHGAEAARATGKKFFGRVTGSARRQPRGDLDGAGVDIKQAQDRAADAVEEVSRAMGTSADSVPEDSSSSGAETNR